MKPNPVFAQFSDCVRWKNIWKMGRRETKCNLSYSDNWQLHEEIFSSPHPHPFSKEIFKLCLWMRVPPGSITHPWKLLVLPSFLLQKGIFFNCFFSVLGPNPNPDDFSGISFPVLTAECTGKALWSFWNNLHKRKNISNPLYPAEFSSLTFRIL